MSDLPTVLVCGLGRCGSSLTMQMLAAGGVPCLGRPPSYEDASIVNAGARLTEAFLREWQGKALKWLDPHRGSLAPGVPVVAFWCERDVQEQAKSQVKFLKIVAKIPGPRTTGPLVRALRHDREASLKVLRNVPHVHWWFEKTLLNPLGAALQMSYWLKQFGIDMDPQAASKVVQKRSGRCRKNMKIETELSGGEIRV